MTVIYVITKVLTLPGAITKAFFEQIMCRIFKCPVEDNRYLRTDEMCGHIEHELINRPVASYMYCFIPGLLNFLFAALLFIFPFFNIVFLGNYSGFISTFITKVSNLPVLSILSQIQFEEATLKLLDFLLPCFFVWLCISLMNNLFPLIEDAMVMKEQYGKLNIIAKIIFFPGYILMQIGARLEKYGISFILLLAATFALAVINP